MSDEVRDTRWLLELARRVDWPKALQRGGALIRTLRGDSDEQVSSDTQREIARGQQVHRTVRGIARAAIGCQAPNACDCLICTEEGTSKR